MRHVWFHELTQAQLEARLHVWEVEKLEDMTEQTAEILFHALEEMQYRNAEADKLGRSTFDPKVPETGWARLRIRRMAERIEEIRKGVKVGENTSDKYSVKRFLSDLADGAFREVTVPVTFEKGKDDE